MSLGLAVLIVGFPLCAFLIWVAKNGIRAEQAEREARIEFERSRKCRCCCSGRELGQNDECSGEASSSMSQ